MMRLVYRRALRSSALVVLALAPAALAHQNGADLPPGESAVVYVYEDHSSPSVWQESNGKVSDGVYAQGDDRTSGRPPLGLHLRGVCYGTFTAAQVDNWNKTFCGSSPAEPYDVFSYLPFDGSAADCSALARAIEGTCDACSDDACRAAEGCGELCGPGYDGGVGACSIEEAHFPPDELLIGVPPSYGVPNGTCHSG